MTHIRRSLFAAIVLLAAGPLVLSLPAVLPGIDAILPFLGGIACMHLGLHFYCGELSDV